MTDRIKLGTLIKKRQRHRNYSGKRLPCIGVQNKYSVVRKDRNI